MSGPTTTEGSEDVNDFLQRIKELGDKRDHEDEERNRKLEEEILQGRKERQARRAERARSISPTKSSPTSTPTASRIFESQAKGPSQSLSPTIGPTGVSEPRREFALDDATVRLAGSTSDTKENSSPFGGNHTTSDMDPKRSIGLKVSPSNAMPSRNSPLSWQRRPDSQASDRSRSRPLSMVATENAARTPRDTPEPASATEPNFSREQIAQSLASKDPAWFRQTADRGLNSPAYRKSQVEDEDRSDHGSNSAKVQMPGMLREGPMGQTVAEAQSDRSSSQSRSSIGSGASYQPSPGLAGGFGSPMSLTPAQKLDPPTSSESRTLAMSPSQGRISPERLDRPVSPTKGMGGFVQSAMMKRSDSVNKRWSVQSPPGLTRGNSVTSNRSSVDPNTSSLVPGGIANPVGRDTRPTSLSRETSPQPNSRPSSSHSNATVTQEHSETAGSTRSTRTMSTSNGGFVKPPLLVSRTQTPIGIKLSQDESSADILTKGETTPPISPSKTMDPRRWSPTKSSWLESALNKPESPKPKAAPQPQQPAWMSEINKAKQKAVFDLGRTPSPGPKHEVSIGGLMRSPPPGGITKPITLGGLPTGLSSSSVPRGRGESITSQISSDSPKPAEASNSSTHGLTTPGASVGCRKIKPETPPKKDFRASLKSRQPSPDNSGASEPEFKNVFGQLRRTKTQNYVAPDELKDNIARGKASLNLTSGPKKPDHKDEFKEAILKKKEDFKKAQIEGKGVNKSVSGVSQDSPLPEALAKRSTLGRLGSIPGSTSLGTSGSSPSSRIIPESVKPTLVKENSTPSPLLDKDVAVSKLAGRLNPALASLLARGPPLASSDDTRSSSPVSYQRAASISASTIEVPESGPQLTHMTKGRARGPRRKAPTTTVTTTASSLGNLLESERAQRASNVGSDPTIQASPKHHINLNSTASRATENVPPKPDTPITTSQPSSPRKLDMKRRSQFLQEIPNNNPRPEPQLDSTSPHSPTKRANSIEIPMKSQEQYSEAVASPAPKTRPDTPAKLPSLMPKNVEKSPIAPSTKFSETTRLRPSPLSPPKLETSPAKEIIVETSGSQPLALSPMRPVGNFQSTISASQREGTISTSNMRIDQESSFPDMELKSVKNVAALWNHSSTLSSTEAPLRVRSPIKLPTHADEKAAMVDAGLRTPSPVKGKPPGGLNLQSASSMRPLPTPPSRGIITSLPPSAGLSPNTDASSTLSDFFTGQSSPKEFKVDTATLVSTRPCQGENIKTLRSSLYQISSDGKKQLVPSHQERILFEGNLYLCTHTYGNAAGKKVTEVYYWQGDEVSKKTVDQVAVFAQREAQSAGGKLVSIIQGKETPEFFHALGGIIIVRRGSSNKYDSLAPHILCCRKHFGQIVFDEVDFSPTSLCSGFPYLIYTQAGKSYLWKGRGSGIEELSCARLIGMDFGLTGEVEEVDDGNESTSFLTIFNDSVVPKSADHWKMKPNYNKYCIRLFRADSNSSEQIFEVSPFCQADLDWSKIFILDAFFEMYIIVGSTAQAEFTSFQHALLFAQEYGILAASMEDRPFIPVTTVILEGVPRDMKSVFRKWVTGLSPTKQQLPAAGNLRRGRSLRVLPLNAALDATRK